MSKDARWSYVRLRKSRGRSSTPWRPGKARKGSPRTVRRLERARTRIISEPARHILQTLDIIMSISMHAVAFLKFLLRLRRWFACGGARYEQGLLFTALEARRCGVRLHSFSHSPWPADKSVAISHAALNRAFFEFNAP